MFIIWSLLCLAACKPEIEVYAPEREAYVVWGVLNPLEQEQFIKISKVFQVEGDALIYASQTDLGGEGFEVFLVGNGIHLEAEQIEIERDSSGIFTESHILYRFDTRGDEAIEGGMRYDLEIRKPEDPDFLITAYTEVPTAPELTNPSGHTYSIEDDIYLYPTLDFKNDYVVYFKSGSAKGFELRVWVDYEENGVSKSLRWGPTPIFTDNFRCGANAQRQELCYEIPAKTVPNSFRNTFINGTGIVLRDSVRRSSDLDSLARVVRMEVTGIDSFLTSYLYSNTPFGFGLNLLMDKPEVSNISGNNVGLFGSIHPSHRYINLGNCAKYLAGLTSAPPPGCD